MRNFIATGIVGVCMTLPAMAGEIHMSSHMMGNDMIQSTDPRTSLNLPEPMRRNQLVMMREHLKAVNEIVADIVKGKFDAAAQVAHAKLGLTPEMKKMCDMLGKHNGDFRKIGLAFHKSADELGNTLQKGNIKHSLAALHRTMNYCIQCHATFRQ